jgi:hypothetical protein
MTLAAMLCIISSLKMEGFMEIYATTVYVISDEVLHILGVKDDPQSKMSNSEVITFAILAAKFFSINYKMCRYFCKKLRLFPTILSISRLNRRIRKIPLVYWNAIFRFLALIFKQTSKNDSFCVDSFPVATCQKSRIDRRKIFLEKKYVGYSASKKRHFCGIKVHMVVTCEGKPIEIQLRPGAENDLSVLWKMELTIPEGSKLYADGAYNSFELEDILQSEGITLLAKRGKRIKTRVRSFREEKEISSKRQIIETAFSCITDLFPKNLRANTEQGFLIKVFCSVLAYSSSFLCHNPLS